jgi:beta-aspartyl-peptidase (threonine type)
MLSHMKRWGLVIHGGAGTLSKARISAQREGEILAALEASLRAGHAVLASGGSALDAVSAAVVSLEDSPHFNAGKGSVFTHEGKHELDASIMDGHTLAAGAVAGVTGVKNPVVLARRVMEGSPHVMLAGPGADAFAVAEGFEQMPPEYFSVPERREELAEAQKLGTVGAVALDQRGHLAAATSTGGTVNKRFGRVGDSPVIGAGTYASDRCAVSCTGHGEHFIRLAVAHDLCARIAYLGVPLVHAAEEIVVRRLKAAGGKGGLIAIDATGEVAMPFNTEGMYRGRMLADGEPWVSIF